MGSVLWSSLYCTSLLLLVNLCTVDGTFHTPAKVLLHILQTEPNAHLQQLSEISDAGPSIAARYFLTPAHRRAATQLMEWMQDAGMRTWLDDIGNVHGRIDSKHPNAPATLFGSHYDTVYDGGKYDGTLGIITAIAAVKGVIVEAAMTKSLIDPTTFPTPPTVNLSTTLTPDQVNAMFDQPIEIIGFCDEEGVRFQSTFLGSSAIAGTLLSTEALTSVDQDGQTVLQVLQQHGFPASEASIRALTLEREKVGEYVEMHIEQGPVLEAMHRPLGVVASIIGQTRLLVKIEGVQGHAGTVPMSMRKDPLVGAAVVVADIEGLCRGEQGNVEVEPSTVCTVGSMSVWPGVVNVIAGSVNLTVDIRSSSDLLRETIVDHVRSMVKDTCSQRGLTCEVEHKHASPTVFCDEGVVQGLRGAIMQAEEVGKVFHAVATCTVDDASCAQHTLPPPSRLGTPSCTANGQQHGQQDEPESCPAHLQSSGDQAKTAHADEDNAMVKTQSTVNGQHPPPVPVLTSGAGHDALAMAALTKVGMVFVRCRGGISHNPLEHVEEEDVGYATAALFAYVRGKLLVES